MAGNIVYKEIVPVAAGAAGGMFAGYYLNKLARSFGSRDEMDMIISLVGVPIIVSANIAAALWLLPASWVGGYVLTLTIVPTVGWSYMFNNRYSYSEFAGGLKPSQGGLHGME